MKSFSADQLALFVDPLEDLIRLHLGHDTFYVLVLRAGEHVNCLSNFPHSCSAQLKDIFAELAQRPSKPLP